MSSESPFYRLLVDFANESQDSQLQDSEEYEVVETSQIHFPDTEETQIVDNENETVSCCFFKQCAYCTK